MVAKTKERNSSVGIKVDTNKTLQLDDSLLKARRRIVMKGHLANSNSTTN